jgi:galactokinase
MDLNKLEKIFFEKYGQSGESVSVYFAPGRVNLIGEHTDYNGGFVLPCALSFGTYLLLRKCSESNIKFSSTNFEYSCTIPLKDMDVKRGQYWINYPLGVLNELTRHGYEPSGLELLYYGNIPVGAGLSSSASIELVTAYAINEISLLRLNKIDLALIGQKAENEFVGMNCGIMDQFIVAMGKSNSALFLNCETLKHSLVPVKMAGYKIVISNTNKVRKLTDSKYNERRNECQTALKEINSGDIIYKNLSEIEYEKFIDLQKFIKDEKNRKRAKHVITENQRVKNVVRALKDNDLLKVGINMYASHESLKNDYEVTCYELDTLVEEAANFSGTIGSRMTGAGFGGCTVSIVKEDEIEKFKNTIGKAYNKKTGLRPDFYIADISEGVHKIK